MENRFVHFKTDECFKQKVRNGEIPDENIVFVQDSNKIYTHKEEYQFVGWSILKVPVPEGYSLYSAKDGTFYVSDGPFMILEDDEF